jgi:nucleoid-associated protein YgaU
MPQIHVVKSGDTLRKIAQQYYDDDSLWRKIYQANKKTIGDDPALIQVGAKLKIPDADGAVRIHVVKAGDSLSSIAERYYGDGSRWKTIYQANKKTIGDDPALIQVGAELKIPEAESDAAKTHVTKEGDTLYGLARQYYDDDSLWKKIYQANKKVIGPNPDVLRPRIELEIPPKS